tara:strand:- start:3391 stop:3561 length:171 start_codon:yes stop_codon:yes gene_type:complete
VYLFCKWNIGNDKQNGGGGRWVGVLVGGGGEIYRGGAQIAYVYNMHTRVVNIRTTM